MKAKSSILTVVLSLFLAGGLLAQETYEYAVFRYNGNPAGKSYGIFFNSATENKKDVGKIETGTGCEDLTPMFVYLNTLIKQGWEVTTANNTSFCDFVYHLRKKKN